MQNPKSDIWVPDTRPESVSTFTESYTPAGGQEQTATYKAIPNHTIIGGILNKLSFGWGHAKATWYNKLAGKTVKDKFDEVDTTVQDLSANMAGKIQGILTIEGVPFTFNSNVISFIYKTDNIILFPFIQFPPNFNPSNCPNITVGAETHPYIGKIDNSNPFQMSTGGYLDTGYGNATVLTDDGNQYLVRPIRLYFAYNGVNTYLIMDSPVNPASRNNMILQAMVIPHNNKPAN